jgi:cytochrome c oxidase subunit 3
MLAAAADSGTSSPRLRATRTPLLPNAVLAVIIVVICEVMFFGGLVSAYVIGEGASARGWPPPNEPRLPVEATAVNSLGLLLSGLALWLAGRAAQKHPGRARMAFLLSLALGATFVIVQGSEWVRLVANGLTLTLSPHAAFFYLIVGAHASHAVVALGFLGWAFWRLRAGLLDGSAFLAVRIFWYFVVGLWPVLYWLVYL